MRRVQLSDDEVQFASAVAEAQAGETVTVLRGDKPVAQIVPVRAEVSRAERLAAIERLKAIMEKGYDLGVVWNGRDELYDRD